MILALTLLLLKLEGDTADWTTLDTLHQVRGVTGNLYMHREVRIRRYCLDIWAIFWNISSTHLVAEALGGNDSDLIADTLVGLEIKSELGIVSLNDALGGFLDGLFRSKRFSSVS